MVTARAQLAAAALAVGLAVSVGACGETASTGSFTGESHNVAQTISNLQSNVAAREQKKLCENDLAASITRRLARGGGGCEAALKSQLTQINAANLKIESIVVTGRHATARVKSTYAGRERLSTLTLVKEGGRWKVSGARS